MFIGIAGIIYVPNEYPTIQAAINTASDGNEIVVLPGIYYETINFTGKNITLTSIAPEDSNIVETTIIDGVQWQKPVVTFSGSETSNCNLQGFTIRNGKSDRRYEFSGGGVQGNNTLATITNCTIEGNYDYSGGGIKNCHGLISNCTIMRNAAIWGGGLIGCDGIIENCIINSNWGETGGGLQYCDGLIKNCIIAYNSASSEGTAGLSECNGSILNCTISRNNSGGLDRCDGLIKNCIIWGNTTTYFAPDQINRSSIPAYSCIQDWSGGGIGNISNDPLFANGALYLKSENGRWDPNALQWVYDDVTSPGIDAGMPWEGVVEPNMLNDWREELWPHGGQINMGAYGGTPQASMSPNPVGNVADLNHDNEVGVIDLDLFCEDWLLHEYLLDTDLNRNGVVDIADWSEFAAQWLWQQE